MAATLWGNVYFQDCFAGILSQEPDGGCSFEYHDSYLQSTDPAISFSLPKIKKKHLYSGGLHPFFDNLCAEGWLKNAQARSLGLKSDNKFLLLLAFGLDLPGSVSIRDPEPNYKVGPNLDNPINLAALSARASISGVQPKIGAVKKSGKFYPVQPDKLATHIAKLSSGVHPGIVELEYLTTEACRALLKNDKIGGMQIASIEDIDEKALIVKRFDRLEDGTRLHFEEFNQLLGHKSDDKYDGCYEDMAKFILNNPEICLKSECDTLFRRIMACILTGNTDAHLKNFAMLHTESGLRLSPSYDLVAASYYKDYKSLALGIENAHNIQIDNLKAKNLVRLGKQFGLPDGAIMLAVEDFKSRLDKAHHNIEEAQEINPGIKDKLHEIMEKRWNGTFASIGTYLSKKR